MGEATGSQATTVGLVGLGTMGSRIGWRLVDAGFELVVCDALASQTEPFAEAGVRVASTPREVADAAGVVLVSLPSVDVVREVALGADGLLHGGAIEVYVDLSTTGGPVAREVASGLRAAGVACVDSPVSGGPSGAENGTLTLMVSGAEADIDRVRPILDPLSGVVFVVGDEPGQGQVAKLVNNLLMAGALTLTAEAMALGVKSGLDPKVLLDVVDASTGQNNAASTKFPRQVLTRQFAHGFPLALMLKDVGLCLEQARSLGVPMPLGSTVDQLVGLASVTQPDRADCTEVARMVEQWAGVEIGSTG